MNELDRMIEILSAERGKKPPVLSESEKFRCFRALVNVRPPLLIGAEFLRLQDSYLKRRAEERGVVRVEEFEYRDRIALWRGDITRLNADAIVNACNSALLGCFQPLHDCIDNAIHTNAGVQVRLDCNALMQGKREPNGQVKVTSAYNLPSRYIFHTVGPIVRGGVSEENRRDLANCYRSCLNRAKEMNLSSLAFCCISTGVFGYPQKEACSLAVSVVKRWLRENPCALRIIFNVFLGRDEAFYRQELSNEQS